MQEQSKPAGSTGEEGGEKRVNVKAEAREPRASQASGAPSEPSFKGDDGSGDPEHSQPCQQGGLTMVRLAQEMKKDAAEQENLVSIIAELISETVQRNDSRNRVSKLAPFEGGAAPIPAVAYVRRIKKYGGCSDCCFVAGLIYLERLKKCEPSVCLTSNNFQRLLLVAVMIASKFLDDFYYSNKHWGEIGGVETAEINYLELEFLFRITFTCTIKRSEYQQMASQLRQYMTSPAPAASAASEVSKLASKGMNGPASSSIDRSSRTKKWAAASRMAAEEGATLGGEGSGDADRDMTQKQPAADSASPTPPKSLNPAAGKESEKESEMELSAPKSTEDMADAVNSSCTGTETSRGGGGDGDASEIEARAMAMAIDAH